MRIEDESFDRDADADKDCEIVEYGQMDELKAAFDDLWREFDDQRHQFGDDRTWKKYEDREVVERCKALYEKHCAEN